VAAAGGGSGLATYLRTLRLAASTAGLGLLPLAFGFGAGAEIQRPMAVAILGGLFTSTLLTLVVIPAVYLLATRDAAPPAAEAS
jgi:Cu/Ag efflux pump CusA